jgi:hypothetical protein
VRRRLENGETPEQALSAADRRPSRFITIDGQTRSLNEWLRVFNTLKGRYCARVGICGWDEVRAFTVPPQRGPNAQAKPPLRSNDQADPLKGRAGVDIMTCRANGRM